MAVAAGVTFGIGLVHWADTRRDRDRLYAAVDTTAGTVGVVANIDPRRITPPWITGVLAEGLVLGGTGLGGGLCVCGLLVRIVLSFGPSAIRRVLAIFCIIGIGCAQLWSGRLVISEKEIGMTIEVQIGFAILAGMMLLTWLMVRFTSTPRKEESFVIQLPNGKHIEFTHRRDSGKSLDEDVLQAIRQWEAECGVAKDANIGHPQ